MKNLWIPGDGTSVHGTMEARFCIMEAHHVMKKTTRNNQSTIVMLIDVH
jgi:hypothetical protein